MRLSRRLRDPFKITHGFIMGLAKWTQGRGGNFEHNPPPPPPVPVYAKMSPLLKTDDGTHMDKKRGWQTVADIDLLGWYLALLCVVPI